MRLDKLIATKNKELSREKIHDLILSGNVFVNGSQCLKASKDVDDTFDIEIMDAPEFVSRAAYKLKHACEHFKINLANRVVLDVGASTGGFTDYCVKNGASRVYAVDVGTDQLDKKLLQNEKVISIEQKNIRDLEMNNIDPSVSLVVADVSFISLTHVIDKISELFPKKVEMVLLIKPQFELTKEEISKTKGLVTSEAQRKKAIDKITKYSQAKNYQVIGITESPIRGKKMGNVEYIIYLR